MPVELRARTAGELLDTAVSMVRSHFTSFLLVALPLYTSGYTVRLLTGHFGITGRLRVASLVFQGVLTVTAETRLSCGARDLLEGRAFGETRTGPIFRRRWAALLIGYMIKWFLVVVGLVLLVLPGAYLIALYFGAPTISAFEDVGVRGARERSRALARPNIGRVFATIGLFDVAVIFVTLLIQYLATGGSMRDLPEWTSALIWLFACFTVMVRSGLTAAVYLDCRIRSEAYDLDPGRLQPAPLFTPA